MRHAYLGALEESGSAVPDTGWEPKFLTLWRGETLHAGLALYLKSHSYGEYVFDWAWAEAFHRHRLPYYPKAVAALPFTPVPSTRLLARDQDARQALAQALRRLTQEYGLSSAHLLFMDDDDRHTLTAQGWLIREGLQFHWTQDATQPTSDFEDLLRQMHRHKRKNILQERRRVVEAGVSFTVHEGGAIDDSLWDFFHRCYCSTYAAHHSTPYLNRDFFRFMARDLPQHWVLFVARRRGAPVAASLIAVDRHRGWAWGPTGARSSTSPACTSRLATTSPWPGASRKVSQDLKGAPRASTRWRVDCCRSRPLQPTGWRTNASGLRSPTS
jgi:predicted N-acyltransferase